MDFKKLTKAQLEEAKNCTTEEAKRAFIEKQKIQLSDEDLNRTVGGGGIIPDVLKCDKCGATFETYTEAIYHVFWEHFIG